MTTTPAGASVAYLSSRYPEPSWTSVDREVDALRAAGWDVVTLSVRQPLPVVRRVPELRARAMTTDVLRAGGTDRLLGRLLRLAGAHPVSLLRAAVRALRTGPRTIPARGRQLAFLAEAAALLHLLERDDVRHVHVHVADDAADIARAAVALGNVRDGGGWSWSLAVHGEAELADPVGYDLAAKAASAGVVLCPTEAARDEIAQLLGPGRAGRLEVVPPFPQAGAVEPAHRSHEDPPVARLAALLRVARHAVPPATGAGDSATGSEIDLASRLSLTAPAGADSEPEPGPGAGPGPHQDLAQAAEHDLGHDLDLDLGHDLEHDLDLTSHGAPAVELSAPPPGLEEEPAALAVPRPRRPTSQGSSR